MSGIAGVLHVDGRPADPALVARMAQALGHRGAGEGQWVSGSIGLAHRTRALADKQPVTDAVHDRALLLDGRLNERGTLGAALRADRRASDAELALLAFIRHDADLPERLVGDFALAAWDGRARTLLCARDACGVKPLFYHWDGRRLLFASEVAALFADATIGRRPDPATIADFLALDCDDPAATFFAGIRRLPGGHTLTVGERGLTVRRWWTPRVAPMAGSDDDCRAAFAERFECAVSDCLRDAPAAGVLLSGGIDSALVAAVAADQRRGHGAEEWLAAVTFMHDGFLAEDRDAIGVLVARGGIRSPRAVWDLPLLDMLLASPEPPDHAGYPALGALLDEVAAADFRVLLTGVGGDELSSAAERGALADSLRGLHVRRAGSAARALVRAYGGDGTDWRAVLDALWSALPPGARRSARQLAGRARPRWLARGLGRDRAPSAARPALPSSAARAVWDALTAPAAALALEKLDADGARLGIELRHPYLHRRVVECVLDIPADVFVRDGYRKQFVQRALESVLPGPRRDVEGREVHVPLADAVATRRREAARFARELFAPGARVFEYVERAEAERMHEAWLRGDDRFAGRLWDFLRLERWLRRTFA